MIRPKGELLNRAFQINLMDPVLVRKVISYKNIWNYLEFETRAERDGRAYEGSFIEEERWYRDTMDGYIIPDINYRWYK